jgi:hypothetical protein
MKSKDPADDYIRAHSVVHLAASNKRRSRLRSSYESYFLSWGVDDSLPLSHWCQSIEIQQAQQHQQQHQ